MQAYYDSRTKNCPLTVLLHFVANLWYSSRACSNFSPLQETSWRILDTFICAICVPPMKTFISLKMFWNPKKKVDEDVVGDHMFGREKMASLPGCNRPSCVFDHTSTCLYITHTLCHCNFISMQQPDDMFFSLLFFPQAHLKKDMFVNVNGQHLYSYDRGLYNKLVQYPTVSIRKNMPAVCLYLMTLSSL